MKSIDRKIDQMVRDSFERFIGEYAHHPDGAAFNTFNDLSLKLREDSKTRSSRSITSSQHSISSHLATECDIQAHFLRFLFKGIENYKMNLTVNAEIKIFEGQKQNRCDLVLLSPYLHGEKEHRAIKLHDVRETKPSRLRAAIEIKGLPFFATPSAQMNMVAECRVDFEKLQSLESQGMSLDRYLLFLDEDPSWEYGETIRGAKSKILDAWEALVYDMFDEGVVLLTNNEHINRLILTARQRMDKIS